ncbi:MAG: membrane protein insertase YidC [Treponema sp.]|jgi:YidC/Oxa1 family membrane protein insertase|nr:membrane protein insertase YidC [Treponema sp.]
MSITEVLYTLIIWFPFALVEFLFVLFKKILDEPGLAVIAVSICINTLLLPIYTVADRWQHEERLAQKRMKPKLDEIRAVFKGDERQMIINTYYRHMRYSPLYALRSSVGLVLQIPFFFAAYQFLSHSPTLAGSSFYFLQNLGEADHLLTIRGFSINIMPLVMTLINVVSAMVYAKDMGNREKAQLYGMALVFLVLLYNSPSGLVLYWTCNNIFSLGKNLASAVLKRPSWALQIITTIAGLALAAGALLGRFRLDRYAFLIAGLGFGIIAAPFAWKWCMKKAQRFHAPEKDLRLLFFSSCAALFLLMGALIPLQVMASEASDFAEPLRYVIRTLAQSFTACVLVPGVIWAFANEGIRKMLAAGSAMLALLALICMFALSASYGVMTNGFKIEQPELISRAFPLWVNAAALAAAAVVPAVFLLVKQHKILAGVYNAVTIAIVTMSIITAVELGTELNALQQTTTVLDGGGSTPPPPQSADALSLPATVFPFTATGVNTFIMFIDRAMGAALNMALDEAPELREQYDGFVWYPNSLSFGNSTLGGLLPIYGGYDYTPLELNAHSGELLSDKANEALTLLPKVFGEVGARVSITDPSMTNMRFVSDLAVFKDIPNVTVQNLDGRFNKQYMDAFHLEEGSFLESFDFDILFRYTLFRISIPLLRYGIHYKGIWWRDSAANAFGRGLTEYSSLYYLGSLCAVDNGTDTFSMFFNETTHEQGAFTKEGQLSPSPISFPAEDIDRFGSEDSAEYMYTFIAALKAVAAWLADLRALGVYDNTRIIIVSDHGASFSKDLFEGTGMSGFNPLLMVKDFGACGPLSVSPVFMTNADVPSIVTQDMRDPKNPHRGTSLSRPFRNSDPLQVVGLISSTPSKHGPYLLNLSGVRPLIGRDIFKAASWGEWESVQ